MNNVAFNAAICLGYLEESNPIAQIAMLQCLNQKDRKKKMEVEMLYK